MKANKKIPYKFSTALDLLTWIPCPSPASSLCQCDFLKHSRTLVPQVCKVLRKGLLGSLPASPPPDRLPFSKMYLTHLLCISIASCETITFGRLSTLQVRALSAPPPRTWRQFSINARRKKEGKRGSGEPFGLHVL